MPAPDPKETILARDRGLAEYMAPVASQLAAVRRCMSEELVAADRTVDEMLACVGERSGKMLRPALMLLTGAACGKLTETHVRATAVVELIHAATLLHDDVLDDAQNRRGAPTANRLWGNSSAVLLGDYVLSKVFVMSARLPAAVAQLLSQATVEICRGELRQNVERRNWRLGEEAYYEIVRQKTASLFAAACRIGSLVVGGPETRHDRFADYGLKIGMAFQITDDLLDILGDEGRVGKTLGTDLTGGKLTLPLIHLLAHAGKPQTGALIAAVSQSGPIDSAAVADMLRASGSIAYARSVVERFCREAAEALDGLAPCGAAESLGAIASVIARRSA